MAARVLPTVHHGVKFRSRSEARWAVVFDSLGWQYHYEPDIYILSNCRYLPDFYLPQHDAFFEVKGSVPTTHECNKARELAELTEKIVIVSHGPPNHRRTEWDTDLSVFYPERDENDEVFACTYAGGFVSRRWSFHPSCSIDLGNLAYLGSRTEIGWRLAFTSAANNRFGVYES